MKFLQYMSFYSVYVGDFYNRFPYLRAATFKEQMEGIEQDGFSGGHLYAPELRRKGYCADFAVVDCYTSQLAWAQEKKLDYDRSQLIQIACEQIDRFKPEVLYISDPIALDPEVLRSCSWKPNLVIAWRAAPILSNYNWQDIDLLLSSHNGCRDQALTMGVKAVEYFRPSFPDFIPKVIGEVTKKWDVIFAGQVGEFHTKRIQFLKRLANMPEIASNKNSLSYFLLKSTSLNLEIEERHIKPAVWGLEMYRTLKQGRIIVNSHIDMAQGESQNMRVYEATGMGSFLITEHSDSLNDMFEPGVEIETYKCQGELEDKIRYYLANPVEREKIAKRGQERCLSNHSLVVRTDELTSLIDKYLI